MRTGIMVLCGSLLLAACSDGGPSGASAAAPSSPANPGVSGLDVRPANTGCIAPARPVLNVTYGLFDTFAGLTFAQPVAVLHAPGDTGYAIVVEQGGLIYRINTSGSPVKTLFANLAGLVDSGPGEAGLLGFAFHPNYAANRQVFASYTTSDDPVNENGANLRSRVSRFLAVPDGSALNTSATARRDILEVAQPYSNHNGGHIAFHPTEGYLYIGFGDGGSGGDPQNRAQDNQTLLGKFLRIDVNVTDSEWNAGTRYKIPVDNPYADGALGLPEIYASGMRNPWRWSFDRQNGELWAGDVGQGEWEEIDRVTRGGNYGWRFREGAHCYNPTSGCPTTGLIDPVVEYGHAVGRCSVTGGHVYRGNGIAALRGHYVYADYCTGEIWSVPASAANPSPQLLLDSTHMISSFGEDAAGELYVLRHNGSGQIFRLTASGGAPGGSAVPSQLSQTGCVLSGSPTLPASGLVPYNINVPFWSDAASKERYLAVPDGSTIGQAAEGRLQFPAGAVLMKNFRHTNGLLIETRLLMHHPDGVWEGYSYEWNASQSDATLVTTTVTKPVNGQDWTFLASGDCLRCHTGSAVFALGTEIAQLNRDFMYSATGRNRNQLATYEAVGLLSTALPDVPANLPQYTSPADTSRPLEERVRTYLHANCANCHRPGGGTPAALDLRHATTLAATNLCDPSTPPLNGDLGVSGARLITPGNPDLSVLYLRMNRRGAGQMPPLASAMVDTEGAALISGWIQGMVSCP